MNVAGHYSKGNLLQRLEAALREDGVDPARPSLETLAPYDHFHGRGLEATRDMAELLQAGAQAHLLDVGSGLGGPARYFAQRFGCRVTGIDLTPEFCDVARHLTRLIGLAERVAFEAGDALRMPFDDATFDGAYSMNVSMNIADKAALYAELARVLKRGGWLALSELAQGAGGEAYYPAPWAANASASFLCTPEETRRGLAAAGFEVVQMRDSLEETRAFAARSREMVERGEKPPHRAVSLIHGDAAREMAANSSRGVLEGRLVPIEVLALKRT